MTNSFVELTSAKIKQHQDAIFVVLTCVLIVCGTFWLIQDKQAGHHEFQSASIIERIYRPATHDSVLVPIDGDGTMMTVDTSMPSQYLVKIALQDKIMWRSSGSKRVYSKPSTKGNRSTSIAGLVTRGSFTGKISSRSLLRPISTLNFIQRHPTMTAEEPDSIFQIIEYNNRAIQAMREQSAIDQLRHEERIRQGQGDTQLHEENMQKLDAISERLFQSRSLQNTSKNGSMIQLSNYLFFTTNCQQALEFYAQCELGDIKEMVFYTASTAPNESMLGKVRHSKFQGLGVLFYASDNHDAEPMRGSAQIIMTDDRAITDRLFTALAIGANVTTPLMTQDWGDYYGKLTDKFGVQWMFNCTA